MNKTSGKYCGKCKIHELPPNRLCLFCLEKDPVQPDQASKARYKSKLDEHDALMKLQLKGDL